MSEAKAYGWDAEQYARNSSAQLQWARELIGKIALRGDERILDIGCGDGKVTAELSRRVPRGAVVGVDSSQAMVEKAGAAFPDLTFRVMDAASLCFENEFDVVFSNATLHWVRNHPEMLSGMRKSLKTGGRLFFQMGGRGNAADVSDVAARIMDEAAWGSFFSGFEFPWSFLGPEEYRQLLAEAGLEPRRVELLPRDMRQKGKDGLLGWLRTTWMPYTERLPVDRREQFLSEVAERYLAGHPLTLEGEAVVRMVRLEVEAIKR